MSQTPAAINISGVSKTYPAFSKNTKPFTALKEITFQIEQGEFFGLLGPNGAGKTTLISILAGLTKATKGSIQVHGQDVQKNFASARRNLGIVPQEITFDPFFKVRETLQFQSGYFGLKKNDEWIDEILHELGLTEKANSNMRELSGGMKRRVMVAQALVHKPPVIVLDEPTAGVDVELRQTLWDFISRLNKKGHTILLTTHYLEEAQALCQRIAMMKNGNLIALEKTSDLLSTATQQIGNTLCFKTSSSLPAELINIAKITNQTIQIPVKTANDIENHLTALRKANIKPEDIEIKKPDLEDVFIKIMNQK